MVVKSEDKDAHSKVKQFVKEKYRCFITSYEAFCSFAYEFKDCEIDILVCDEGHRLKNPNTKQYRTLTSLNAKRRILITGTPIQNNLMELYACVNFVHPTAFKTQKQFKFVYAEPISKGLIKGASENDRQLASIRSKELEKLLFSFMIRRTQKILEEFLPKRHEFIIYLKPTDIQRKLYDKCLEDYKSANLDKGKNVYSDTFSLITSLRKILTHPDLLRHTEDERQILNINWKQVDKEQVYDLTVKFAMLAHILADSSPEKKTIIVSYFTTTLDKVGEFLENRLEIKYCRLDGSNSTKQRDDALQQFARHSNYNVLLLGGKAGGTGLNIVCACRMVLMEVEWNPSSDAQVMGRIYRKGQMREVFIYRLVATGSVEEKVMQRQMMKRELGEKVVGGKKSREKSDVEGEEGNQEVDKIKLVCNKGRAKEDEVDADEEEQGIQPGTLMGADEFKQLFNKMGPTVGKFVQKRKNFKAELIERVKECKYAGDLIEYVLVDEEKGIQIDPLPKDDEEDLDDKSNTYINLLEKQKKEKLRDEWVSDCRSLDIDRIVEENNDPSLKFIHNRLEEHSDINSERKIVLNTEFSNHIDDDKNYSNSIYDDQFDRKNKSPTKHILADSPKQVHPPSDTTDQTPGYSISLDRPKTIQSSGNPMDSEKPTNQEEDYAVAALDDIF